METLWTMLEAVGSSIAMPLILIPITLWLVYRQFKGAGYLVVALVFAGLLETVANGGLGYSAYEAHALKVFAKILEATVAIAVIPEAYDNGFFTAYIHWSKRSWRLMFWLTIGLVVRTFTVVAAAKALGLHNPLAVGAGFMATDPAATGISLGLVGQVMHLAALFWQLTVESLLNDAAGIAVFGLANGQTLLTASQLLMADLGLIVLLAVVQTAVQVAARSNPQLSRFEMPVVLIISAAFVGIGVVMGVSLILLTAGANILADLLDDALQVWMEVRLGVPRSNGNGNNHAKHQWHALNEFMLGVILAEVTFMVPFALFAKDPAILLGGGLLLGAVFAARSATALAELVGPRWMVPHRKDWHDIYTVEAALVHALAGTTMLGVPSIVAFDLAAHGDTLAANYMLAAIVMSWVFIPLAVFAIKWAESYGQRHHVPDSYSDYE